MAHPSATRGELLKASTRPTSQITVEAWSFWAPAITRRRARTGPSCGLTYQPDSSAVLPGSPSLAGSRSCQRTERLLAGGPGAQRRGLRQGQFSPLITRLVSPEGWAPFQLRLASAQPRNAENISGQAGPRANPFLPWEPPLEVERLAKAMCFC